VTITDDDIIAVDPPASIGDITDNGGKTYFNCMLVKIEPDGLNVLHQAGAAKLLFTDLSPDLQKKYHYNPTKDAIYRNMEAKHMADSDEARAITRHNKRRSMLRLMALLAIIAVQMPQRDCQRLSDDE